LDPVLERMMEAGHRYEGTVNQVMGDGALDGAVMAPLTPVGLLDHSGHDGRLGNTTWDLAPDAVPPGPERRIDGGEGSPPGDAALEDGCVDPLPSLAD